MADDQKDDFQTSNAPSVSAPTSVSTGKGKVIKLADADDDFTPIQAVPGNQQPLRMFPQGPGQKLTDEAVGTVLNNLRPFISGTVQIPSALLGGAPGGIAGYAIPDMAMKMLNPVPALRPESTFESMTDSVKEGAINEIGGRILEGVFGGLKALRNAGVPDPSSILKLNPTTAQALENYGYHKLAKLATFIEDYGAPAAKAKALDNTGGEGFTQALLLSNRMNSGGRFTKNVFQDPSVLKQKIMDTLEKGIDTQAVPGQFQSNLHYASQEAYDLMKGGASPFEAIDDVMNDSNKLNKVLSVGQAVGPKNLNVRKDLQAYYWNRIFDEATTTVPGGGARIDPAKINDLWFNPKSGELAKNLETLYGKQGKQDLDRFMKNVIGAQTGNPNLGLAGKAKYLGSGFALGGLLDQLVGHGTGPLIGSGLYVANGTMGRLLTNPSVGKGVIDMLTHAPISTPNRVLARGIFNALEGSRVAIVDKEGKKNWGGIVRAPDGTYQFIGE